jgi:hypothetical protein
MSSHRLQSDSKELGRHQVKMTVLRLRSRLLNRFPSEKSSTGNETDDMANNDTISLCLRKRLRDPTSSEPENTAKVEDSNHPRRSKRLRNSTTSEPEDTAKAEDSIHLRLGKRQPDPTSKVNSPHLGETLLV